MDIFNLYKDFGVDAITEGNKHCSNGWVNVHCPFCSGAQDYHLGYEIANDYFFCWRCGWHPILETVSKILRLPTQNAFIIVKQYKGTTKQAKAQKTEKKPFLLPNHLVLTKQHIKYLRKRKFDSDYLSSVWGVQSTGPVSKMDELDYKHRILIPVFWDNKMVSYLGRDATDRSPTKYLVCPKDREVIHHKKIIYGLQRGWRRTGICVEGPTDVWRMGVESFATFGIEFKAAQVRIIAKLFDRVAILYDDEPQAVEQANKLVAELRLRGVDSWRENIKGDPGSMKQSEADYMVKTICY